MGTRESDLLNLENFIDDTDKEITMILQNLQWDRKQLLEDNVLAECKYDVGHKVPLGIKDQHENGCYLKCQGYKKDDKFLPNLLDPEASTVVKLTNEEIKMIITNAAKTDFLFKKGPGCDGCEPLTADRLLVTYTPDERRAIHDAVVSAVPDFEQVDVTALSGTSEPMKRCKSKLEILAELRNMRRRRVRYRGAAASSKNYSNVLRDLIKTQMETYTGATVSEISNISNTNKIPDQNESHECYKHSVKSIDSGNKSDRFQDDRNCRRYSVDVRKSDGHEKYKNRVSDSNFHYRRDSHSGRQHYASEDSIEQRDYRRKDVRESAKDERRHKDNKYEESPRRHRDEYSRDKRKERSSDQEGSYHRSKKRHRKSHEEGDKRETKYTKYWDTSRENRLTRAYEDKTNRQL